MTTQEFEMPASRSLFVHRLMFLNTCLTCTIKYILIWLQTFLTLEISSIYPPHVPIYTYFNKGCFGNRALVFESHCLVVTQAKHCIVFCVSMTKSQSNLYWNRCICLHRAVDILENFCWKMSRPINRIIPPDAPRATPSMYCFQIFIYVWL